MADKGFNGSSILLGGTEVTNLRSISYSNQGAAVDVSSLSTTTKAYVVGQRDPSCTIKVCGQAATTFAVGLTGVMTVKFFDATSQVAAQNIVVTGHEISGDLDGAIETTITIKPA